MTLSSWLMAIAALSLSACSSTPDEEPEQQATSVHMPRSLAQSMNADPGCSLVGGTTTLARQLDGSSVGMCQLSNGRQCELGALKSGACRAN
ncbi:putative hemolysin [Biostraticola tofi]|uniref:Putative hemolysin n=1 Tax=Biostraticola tofi TaxID=466109 RepID=A0A4R3Z466_9GAMM|nr:DUF333 domain-containing protein [Biostraticola tofi]TCV99848.1 putative hemolysin [Biostraticola tofi]